MAFSTVPAPLYVLYAGRDGFGPLLVTVIFAAYAVGVLASLFLAGHLSDWMGRRRMAAASVAVNLVSGVIFLTWTAVPALLIARVVSGVSIGLMTATATAYLSELDAAGHGRAATAPGRDRGHRGQPGRPRPRVAGLRPQRISVPAQQRPLFYAAGVAAAAGFALFGLFTSLAPGFLAGTLHDPSHALAGTATFAVFGAAAVAQAVLGRTGQRHQLIFGIAVLVLGLALLTAAVWAASLALLLAAGVLGRERGGRPVQGQRVHGAGHRPAGWPR